MASDRGSTAPLIDLAATAVSPALVMLMVGSLTFFLVTVFYQGNYPERLLWTMFFFVFGAVLIARLSIQFGRKYAAIYAAGLGGACFLAMMAYVDYPPGVMKALGPVLNLLLIALIWWSADKLTWDCTHFDDDRKTSGKGVLAAAGLDEAPPEPEEAEEPDAGKKKKRKKSPDAFVGWVERFHEYREAQKKKPHTPGVWVLRFSLAALPLFALGQSLIDPADSATRRATFFQMAVYVGSGLGLLVTTTLFGLKRYLEQRNARIPPVMVASWLGLGGGLIVLFLALGAALPRPHSETPWFGMKRTSKSERDASRYAVIKDGSAGKGKGAAGKKTETGDGKNSAKGGKQGGGNAGEKGSGGGKGDSQGGKQSGGERGNQSGNKAGQGDDRSQGKADNRKGEQRDRGKSDDRDSGSRSDSKSEQSRDAEQNNDGEQSDDADKSDSNGGSDTTSSGLSRLENALGAVGTFIKWVVWVVVALAVVFGILIFVLKWLAPFTGWAKGLLDWLRGLFLTKPKAEREAEEEAAAEAVVERPPPFDSFSNPFADGTARRRDPAELVEYTFAALDAWAWDEGRGRSPGETPLEFAVRIGHEYAELDEPTFNTANLYVRVLYSRSALPADALQTLKTLWAVLESSPVPAQ